MMGASTAGSTPRPSIAARSWYGRRGIGPAAAAAAAARRAGSWGTSWDASCEARERENGWRRLRGEGERMDGAGRAREREWMAAARNLRVAPESPSRPGNSESPRKLRVGPETPSRSGNSESHRKLRVAPETPSRTGNSESDQKLQVGPPPRPSPPHTPPPVP